MARARASLARVPCRARWSCLGALLLGSLLVVLALPRLIGAILDLPGDRVVFALKQGQVVTDEALEGLVAVRRASLGWHERAEAYRDIGAAQLALVYRRSDPGVDRAALKAAEVAIRRALMLAPVDPYSWARLATIAWIGEREAIAAAQALRASIRVGAYDPDLAAWRTRLVLTLWPHLSTDDRLTFLDQIRQLWRHDPDALARLTLDEEAFRIALAALIDPVAIADLRARRETLRPAPVAPGATPSGLLDPSRCCE